ncbi:MAG: hypothetical protein FJX76_13325 [Armatimonadetes bacterium]|nr:hypothetical protein [Armatimonadota bacterium]
MDHTIIHETAHALDDIKSTGTKEWASEQNTQLQSAFEAYKDRISEDRSKDWDAQYNAYAATNILEFTAEASRMYLESEQTRNTLQTLDPQTYSAIQNLLGAA